MNATRVPKEFWQMSKYKHALIEREGPIIVVTINRPEVMNALHDDAHAELQEIFDTFARDASQWVAIITGAGDTEQQCARR